ncbi:MAG: 50S ribosomal protein L21 [Armatimonadota bacterium]
MYAIIECGGQQFRVEEKDVISVDRLPVEVGEEVEFDNVLAAGEGEDLKVGAPYVKGAKVVGKAVAHERGRKLRVFKYKAKKRYRRSRGHRQNLTKVLISSIEA